MNKCYDYCPLGIYNFYIIITLLLFIGSITIIIIKILYIKHYNFSHLEYIIILKKIIINKIIRNLSSIIF